MNKKTYFYLSVLAYLMLAALNLKVWSDFDGLPYFKDNNESYLSYIQGRNLVVYDASKFSYLTAQDTNELSLNKLDDDVLVPAYIYTHNPNFPRYLHAFLLIIGVDNFRNHILTLGMAAGILSFMALGWICQRLNIPPLNVVIIFSLFIFDFSGFSSFFINTYRSWSFVLFFAAFLCLLFRKNRLLIAATFFCTFQFEYAFAIFVSLSAITFILIIEGRNAIVKVIYAGVGVFFSLANFFIKVVTNIGVQGTLKEIAVILTRRSNLGDNFLLSTRFPFYEFGQSIVVNYGWTIGLITVLGFILSFFYVLRALYFQMRFNLKIVSGSGFFLQLAIWLFSIIIGGIGTAFVLPNYVVDAYFNSGLPFISFFVSLSSLVVISWASIYLSNKLMLRQLIRQRFASLILLSLGFFVILFLYKSSYNFYKTYPPIENGYIEFITENRQNSMFIVDGSFHGFPTALNNSPSISIQAWGGLSGLLKSSQFNSFKEHGRHIYYICGPFYRTPDFCNAQKNLLSPELPVPLERKNYFIVDLTSKFIYQ